MKNITVYDDYNRRVKSDQSCIGTVMPNFKNEALGNGTKLIEIDDGIRFRRLTPKECWRLMGYIDDYNSLRPHEALDYATPDEVYRACFSVNGVA